MAGIKTACAVRAAIWLIGGLTLWFGAGFFFNNPASLYGAGHLLGIAFLVLGFFAIHISYERFSEYNDYDKLN